MNVKLPKTINELYTLAYKCARVEEGRRLPREEAGVGVDSDDDEDATGSKGRKQKHNKKRTGKAVLAVKSSGDLRAGKKAKAETPGKGSASCIDYREAAAVEKTGKSDGPYCKIHHAKGHDIRECRQVGKLAETKKAEYEEHDEVKGQDGAVGKAHGGRGGRRGKAPQQKEKPARGHEKKEEDDVSDAEDDREDSSDKEFQRATDAMCVNWGASMHFCRLQLK
ncbi:hypothetical protein ZWY2020_021352 [Hordeum vulgare]|nr:hypothetical protein ZWY2020_021352 [Hordeum vulgare]